MKKYAKLLVAGALALSMLVGCGNSAAPANNSGSAAASGETTGEAKSFTIGMIDPGSTDATSKPLYDSLQQTITALGGEYVMATLNDNSADGVVNAVQNLLSKGVNGIILANTVSMYGAVPSVADLCDQNKVYWSLFWTNLEEGTEEYQVAMESPYFISTTCEDDVYSGYFAGKTVGEQGAKNICTITLPEGFTTTNMRNEGFNKAAEEYGMTLLGSTSDPALITSASGGATITEDFLAAYPDVDGIAILGMSQFVLSGVMQTLEDAGRTDIAVGCIDFNEFQATFMESGMLDGMIGGHFAGPTYSAILMANAIQGTPLVEGGQIIRNNFIELNSYDDAKAYEEKIYGKCLYTDDELKNCLKSNNPDFTYEQLLQMAESYGLQDILDRTQK